MLTKALLKSFAPFAAPLLLLVAAVLLGRQRIAFLRAIPLWVFLAAIGLVVLIWLLVAFLKWRAEKKNAAAIEAGLGLDAPPGPNVRPDLRPEYQELQANMKEAIATLKRSPQGSKALYTIPWYVIVGPPAIGKTTAIRNSGLNFPGMTTAKWLRGQGGTRNCEWWLSTDAIILDTAGRYAQSADRSDTEPEWFSFLDLLKRNRKKAPLNGLILAYSMETVIESDEMRVIADARELRSRIDEITAKLNWSFPVYVLFTKCDLVAGFGEFFSSMPPVERLQVWGSTFSIQPSREARPSDHFLAEYDLLLERLRALRTQRIVATDREDSWGRVFMFPEEMAALRQKLHVFVETLFEANPFVRDQPVFRGVYVSSGRQMGRPLEIVVGRIQSLLGAAPAGQEKEQEEKEDAYFVRDLFTKVFRLDHDLARVSRTEGRKSLRIKWAVAGATALLALVLSFLITVSYGRLQNRMNATQEAAGTLASNMGRDLTAEDLQLLRRLREQVAGSWKSGPLVVAERVRKRAGELYQTALRNRVLVPAEDAIRSRLDSPGDLDGAATREALRAELLLLHPEKSDDIGESQDLARGLQRYGLTDLPEAEPVAQDLDAFSKDFLEARVPLAPADSRREPLRSAARRLRETHEPEEYYARIIAGASLAEKDLTLDDVAGDGALLSSERVIRAAYTKSGWTNYVSKEIRNVNESIQSDNRLIVMAGESPGDRVPNAEELLQRYTDAYPQEWSGFMEAVELRPCSDCAAAKEVYSTLKGPNSPLIKIVQRAEEEAHLGGKTDFLRGNGLAPIEKAMAPLHDLVEPPEKEATFSIAQYRAKLGEVQSALSLCAKGKLEEAPPGIDETVEAIRDFAAAYSGPTVAGGLESLLLLPFDQATGVIEGTAGSGKAKEAASAWQDQVLAPYEKAIKGKYPFRIGSEQAALPAAVASFFKSEGPLSGFEAALKEKAQEPGPGMQAAIRAASDIRDALGADQGTLSSSFRMKVSPAVSLGGPGDANLKQIDLIELVVNGQKISVRSSTQSKPIRWSSDDADPASYLSARQSTQNKELGRIDGGSSTWSWFRLVDQASAVEQQGEVWRITWTFDDLGVSVTGEITMNQGSDLPFGSRSTFRTFSLPAGYAN